MLENISVDIKVRLGDEWKVYSDRVYFIINISDLQQMLEIAI